MNQESNWKECVETNSSIKVSPDTAKAKSSVSPESFRIIRKVCGLFYQTHINKENNKIMTPS
ncbi:MAG: hypothetical protein Q7K43_02205 [Candidatus Woesearchaeota archaeon]|nr:hypothetical protein [Candidatus Woesearchaeota archaeon]